MNKVDIRYGVDRRRTSIKVDDQEVTSATSIKVELSHDQVPRVTMELDVFEVQSTGEGGQLVLGDGTKDLLLKFGWQPPRAVGMPTKVRFDNLKSGLAGEIQMALRHLTPGGIYTLRSMDVGRSGSHITLYEIGRDIRFNSCLFNPVFDENHEGEIIESY